MTGSKVWEVVGGSAELQTAAGLRLEDLMAVSGASMELVGDSCTVVIFAQASTPLMVLSP